MISAGIDAGSRYVKVVLLDRESRELLACHVVDQGIRQQDIADDLLHKALAQAQAPKEHTSRIVATGYGRDAIEMADTTITEITCHARGVHHLHPEARTVVDIGGQDSKLLRLEADGRVRDFVMNDRCAAGTGRFLEVVASRLQIDISDLGTVAAKADAPATISSMCVVFAETEIIGLLASGESPENIVAGVQTAIASRIASMAGRHVQEPILFTGGVAMIPGMAKQLERVLERPVRVADHAQFTGAIGAALMGADSS